MSKIKKSKSRVLFLCIDYFLLILTAFVCILPLINVFAISLSGSAAAAAGKVRFWPVDFNINSYKYALGKAEFLQSFLVTLKRVGLGYVINMLMTISIAYPLSKEKKDFRWRNVYAWMFIITMMFNGGLIPTYMTVGNLKLLDTIWALVIPSAVPIFNVILMMNFFRSLPHEIEEAAMVDGAGHVTILTKIFLPLSKASLATVSLFVLVNHWNSWFDGLIYMNQPKKYPLSSYLRTIVIEVTSDNLAALSNLAISDRTFKAAQVFLAALPILLVYPFLQKYFMKGVVMGSVKG